MLCNFRITHATSPIKLEQTVSTTSAHSTDVDPQSNKPHSEVEIHAHTTASALILKLQLAKLNTNFHIKEAKEGAAMRITLPAAYSDNMIESLECVSLALAAN